MSDPITRRGFVAATAAAGGFAFLDRLPELDAAPTKHVRLAEVASDIEPLVKLLEDTDRGDLLDKVVGKIRGGTSYQELLAAVFLAGVRGIQPRPVGFKFHAVLVINSAHLASLAATDKDRWLPLLWSIDYFKSSQAANKTQGDWRMSPADATKLPGQDEAKKTFLDGMNNWDVEKADRGITAWGRAAGAAEVFEAFWRLGARDFRDIGHKAIYAANAWRTLQTIGWRHAEPVVRSLAYGMLDHEDGNPATRDDWRDRPGRDNLVRLETLKPLRFDGKRDASVGKEVLAALRTVNAADASKLIAERLDAGVHPAAVWDGLFLQAGELLMRQPGIVGLHTLTSLNALHFAYETSAVERTRAFLILQAAAFLPLFRDAMSGRGKVSSGKLDALEKLESNGGIDEVFADVSRDRTTAARKTLDLLQRDPRQTEPLMRQARRLIFAKGASSHDYKFSSAVLEDVYQLARRCGRRSWRRACSTWGSGDKDNSLIRRSEAALAKG
ncbi:MAG: hypothetical protein U0797_12130 [Gemmataceae bacterium]